MGKRERSALAGLCCIAALAITIGGVGLLAGPARGAAPPALAASIEPFDRAGVAVYDRGHGRLTVAYEADAEFTSASLVKLLIALEALAAGVPEDPVRTMLARSDDDIASRLWVDLGGGRIVSRWAARLELTGTSPPSDPGRWGDTSTTANDIVRVYRYLVGDVTPYQRGVILGALRHATHRAADGFDQFFGIPGAARDAPFAVKQGWACCRGTRTLHTTGLVGPRERYVVVVLTESPVDVSWPTAAEHVTALAADVLRMAGRTGRECSPGF